MDILGEPNGLKSEVAVAWVRGRMGIGRGPCGEPHRSAAVEPLFPFTPVIQIFYANAFKIAKKVDDENTK